MMNDLTTQAAESSVISSFASKATIVSGTGTAVYSAFLSEYLFTIIGIACTIGTLVVNWYYKKKELMLKEEHERMVQEANEKEQFRRDRESQARIAVMNRLGVSELPSQFMVVDTTL